MVYRYNEVIARYGSAYDIRRAVASGSLFKVGRGVYSDEHYPDTNATVCALWPQAVLTMDTAFNLHDLTDVVPDLVHVATPRNSTRIRDPQVRQHFMLPQLMSVGVQTMNIDGSPVRVFTRERMLVELLRCVGKLPFDYYKELIGSYRRIVYDLGMYEVEDCMALYKRADGLFSRLQREVL